MVNKRNIIQSIIVAAVGLLIIVAVCLRHVSQQRKANETYADSTPYAYISSPREASIYIVDDINSFSLHLLPQIDATHLPDPRIWRTALGDAKQYIALYPDGEIVFWCAIHPDRHKSLLKFVADSLCDGYMPIKERVADATLYHFSTRDGRFLHIFIDGGVIGCSHSEPRLVAGREEKPTKDMNGASEIDTRRQSTDLK